MAHLHGAAPEAVSGATAWPQGPPAPLLPHAAERGGTRGLLQAPGPPLPHQHPTASTESPCHVAGLKSHQTQSPSEVPNIRTSHGSLVFVIHSHPSDLWVSHLRIQSSVDQNIAKESLFCTWRPPSCHDSLHHTVQGRATQQSHHRTRHRSSGDNQGIGEDRAGSMQMLLHFIEGT